MNSLHNFTTGAALNRQQYPLTIDQLRQRVPSAFALDKHESRSDRYRYIPTIKVIEAMMDAGFLPYKAIQSNSRIPGKSAFTKHMIRFRRSQYDLVVGDTVPEIVLINAHDGTSAYQLSAGFWRLVCSNGLMVSEGFQESIRVYHKGNIEQEVIDGSNAIVNNTGKAVQAIETWDQLRLTDGEQKVFAEAAHTMRFADSEGKVHTPITVEQLLRPRRSADSLDTPRGYGQLPKPDLWTTFNVVQENVIKGHLHGRANGRRVSTKEVRGIDQDVRLNRALWQLAERMAELKGVKAA